EAPPTAAPALMSVGFDANMAYFARRAVRAAKQPTPKNDTAADACPKRNAYSVFEVAGSAEPVFTDRGGGRIVFQNDLQPKPVGQTSRKWKTVKSRYVRSLVYGTVLSIHNYWGGNPDRTCKPFLPNRLATLRSKVGNRIDDGYGIVTSWS